MKDEEQAVDTPQEQTDDKPQEQPQQQAIIKKTEFTPERTAEAIKRLPAALQGIRNLFASPWESFRATFRDPKEADRVMQREITYASQAMCANNYLIKCAAEHPQEFIDALKNVALSGLSLNPTIKQGYLVPFKGKVAFMPSYMGMVDMLANNGHVKKIEAFNVFEGDEFEMSHGTEEYIRHKPNPWGERTREKFLGAYWVAVLTDGTKMFNNMTKAEIEMIMKRSPSVAKGQSSPWETDYLAMARKTCLRQGFKSLPKGSISDERLKVLDAVFDYDEKVEQDWIKREKNKRNKTNNFDEDVEETTFEEVE